jgi:hypothetical protein
MSAKKSKATNDSDSPLVSHGELNEESSAIDEGGYHGMNADMEDLMPPAYRANNQAYDGLAELASMAKGGDKDAMGMFYEITCGMVERLNELHADYAASVLEWPVLLPRDREKRQVVTKQANAMRIGSSRGAGEGSGGGTRDDWSYDKEKGFAIHNLRRVDFARALLHPIPPVYVYDGVSPPEVPIQIQSVIDDPSAFQATTEITNFGAQLLSEISELLDYSADTREDWIRVMVAVLRRNRHLIPEKFQDNKCKVEISTAGGKTFTDKSWQGARIANALRGGLAQVSTVPGIWGQ